MVVAKWSILLIFCAFTLDPFGKGAAPGGPDPDALVAHVECLRAASSSSDS